MPSVRTALLLTAVAVGTLGVYVGIFVLDTTKDNPATLDVQPVKGVAEKACTELRLELDAMPPLPVDATAQQRRDRIAAQDRTVRTLISTVQGVGATALAEDETAAPWLADWATLADARAAYAAAGATGPFAAPVVDGHPIAERMSDALADCVVPVQLTTAP